MLASHGCPFVKRHGWTTSCDHRQLFYIPNQGFFVDLSNPRVQPLSSTALTHPPSYRHPLTGSRDLLCGLRRLTLFGKVPVFISIQWDSSSKSLFINTSRSNILSFRLIQRSLRSLAGGTTTAQHVNFFGSLPEPLTVSLTCTLVGLSWAYALHTNYYLSNAHVFVSDFRSKDKFERQQLLIVRMRSSTRTRVESRRLLTVSLLRTSTTLLLGRCMKSRYFERLVVELR